MKWVNKKSVGAAAGGIALIAAVTAFIVWPRVPNPIPTAIRLQSPIGLFYPAKLPEGFTIDEKSFAVTNGVTSYTVHTSTGQTLFFTQQKPPANFDFENFATKQIEGPRRTSSQYGDVILGTFQKSAVASLRTPDNWLLISSADTSSLGNLETIATNLRVSAPIKK